jgi:hypothetical protein
MAAFPKWSTVRGFGNVTYFNLSYVVLLGVPILHELYERSVPFMKWFGAPGPFPSTLKWLYAASFSYAIAIGLYQWFCPAEIKRFGKNEDEYLKTQHEIYLRALPNHRLNVILAHLDPILDNEVHKELCGLLEARDKASGEERSRYQCQLDEVVKRLHPDAVQRYLLKAYEQSDTSRPLARWTSFVLYLLGTVIVLWLLGVRSYRVIFDE